MSDLCLALFRVIYLIGFTYSNGFYSNVGVILFEDFVR